MGGKNTPFPKEALTCCSSNFLEKKNQLTDALDKLRKISWDISFKFKGGGAYENIYSKQTCM
jgi:hypothetical protein